jgi:hypothetical protein
VHGLMADPVYVYIYYACTLQVNRVFSAEGGHWDKMSESEENEYNCVRRLQRFIFLEGGSGGGGG